MRRTIKTNSEVFFGSVARSEVFYYLFVSKGLWIDAWSIAGSVNMDYKSVKQILEKIEKIDGVEKRKSFRTEYRIPTNARLFKILQSLFLILKKDSMIKHKGRNYWFVRLIDDVEPFSIYLSIAKNIVYILQTYQNNEKFHENTKPLRDDNIRFYQYTQKYI